MNAEELDNAANDTVAAGAVLAALHAFGIEGEPVDTGKPGLNTLSVKFPFMLSHYRVTVERIPDPDQPG